MEILDLFMQIYQLFSVFSSQFTVNVSLSIHIYMFPVKLHVILINLLRKCNGPPAVYSVILLNASFLRCCSHYHNIKVPLSAFIIFTSLYICEQTFLIAPTLNKRMYWGDPLMIKNVRSENLKLLLAKVLQWIGSFRCNWDKWDAAIVSVIVVRRGD